MKPFADATAALQVGTRRSPCSKSEYLGEWVAPSAEKGLLVDAGVLDLMRRAGATPFASATILPEAPSEPARIVEAAAGPLIEAIDLGLTSPIIDWAKAAAQKGAVAPHSALLKLIAMLSKHREELRPVLGARGEWLAGLMGVDLGPAEATLPLDQFRAWLTAEWVNLEWKQRADQLERLRPHVAPADEPLLTAALQDRRKEVREVAAKGLASLDESAFATELRDFARPRIQLVKKLLSRSLQINLPSPDLLPKHLPRTPKQANIGEQAHALFDVLVLIRPAFWEAQTGLSPPDLLAMAAKTEYREVIVPGWHEAAITWKDQPWIDALFEYYMAGEGERVNYHPGMAVVLAPMVSAPVFETVYRARMKAVAFLPSTSGHFSPGFSALVVQAARNQTINLLREHERCLDLSVLPLLREPWDGDQPSDQKAEALRQYWYRCLDLRARLIASLNL